MRGLIDLLPSADVRRTLAALGVTARATARDLRTMLSSDGLVALRYQGSLAGAGSEPLSLLFVDCEKYASEFDCYVGGSRDQVVCPSETLFRGNLLDYAFAHRRLEAIAAQCDIVVQASMLPRFSDGGDLLHFPMMEGNLPVQPNVELQIQKVRSKAHRRRLRKASKSDRYTSHTSSRLEDFERFYDELYAPYIRERFGTRAHTKPRERMLALFLEKGQVLEVRHGGQRVAGALLLSEPGSVLAYHSNGFAPAHLPALALAQHTAALEVAVMRYAIENRFRSIGFGYTRAILSEGLFTHKRRMGCVFTPAHYSPLVRVTLKANKRPAIFHAFPMLSGGPGELVAQVGFDARCPQRTVRQWRSQLKNYPVAGLTRITFHTNAAPGDAGRRAYETALRQVAGSMPIDLVSSVS